MLEELVAQRGGAPARSRAEALEAGPGARFTAVLVEDDGILPAIARLSESDPEAYLLKAGLVGGPEGEPGARRVEPELLARVLDAALRGEVTWEEDPDFGYELATAVPGLTAADDGLLVPRFLYARNGRVYEHAALVPGVRAEHPELLGSQAAS